MSPERVEPYALGRLLGLMPDDDGADRRPVSVMEAAAADPRLGEREREILAAVYRELVRQHAQGDGTATPVPAG